MLHIADYGAVIEAYDGMPSEVTARVLAVATRAERHSDWRGWRVESDTESRDCGTKREARRWLELLADRTLAELEAPDFMASMLERIQAAVNALDGAAILAALEYLAAEGDAELAAGLAETMRTAGLIEDGS
jgi:hypothetical protein